MNAQLANWDDLRVFLAVARAGSLSGAARSLGVNHSTVFRRIAGFEDTLGVRLFDRLPTGYALTPAGEETLGIVARIEADVTTLDRTVTGQDLRLSGTDPRGDGVSDPGAGRKSERALARDLIHDRASCAIQGNGDDARSHHCRPA